MNVQKSEKGFTIIEVVLVLAIAGLIFLMVFIALPALQRSQRDQARKNDASTVAAAVQTFKGNNNGGLTGLNDTRIRQYIDKLDQYDKDTGVALTTAASVNPNLDQVLVRVSSKCPTTLPAPGTALTPRTGAANGVTNRNAIAVVKLENNGANGQWQIYCVEV
ncbi:MAG TPA: prepilin-type N-terminal cleavage/methylation domain-containing protein [Candidatus Saccharibacteria bacterium]|nr:prepilin-type N-terminal cleavage/methylation domain-containing protein [Candidatus Saccharibacteria bacterium]